MWKNFAKNFRNYVKILNKVNKDFEEAKEKIFGEMRLAKTEPNDIEPEEIN